MSSLVGEITRQDECKECEHKPNQEMVTETQGGGLGAREIVGMQ